MNPNPVQQNTTALTEEQIAITTFNGNMAINAVAGSGKTTTIIEYASLRPGNSKILYLAFNKSVKLEAVRKFASRNLHQVKVETAHSLAYKHIVAGREYSIKAQGYKTHELVELLGLAGTGEKHAEYIIANHINKFTTYFCNSDKLKVQDLNYLDTIVDSTARSFVRSFYKFIENGTRLLLAKMDKGEIEITHDFYLKKFQLSNPVLHYDYILFDEGQDASAAMLQVFMQQKAVKVIVGDAHQQIYGWRYAVNSLAKTGFHSLQLSTSFRFVQDIANLAMRVLSWKSYIMEYTPVSITGKGKETTETTKATIARTNLGLLLQAIEFTEENTAIKHIYFEGNINSYTYADDGTSLYDVLSLYNHRRGSIRDPLIKSMKDLDELEEYIDKTEDVQLGMMVEIVKKYGNKIPGILKSLKDKHTGDDDRHTAAMIFSTVHRAKGMEYDVVHLVNDFITEVKLERIKAEPSSKKEPVNVNKLNEEINLLYVAITRTKNKLYIPEALLPKEFPASPNIHVVKAPQEVVGPDYLSDYELFLLENGLSESSRPRRVPKDKVYTVPQRNKDAFKLWTPALDTELKELFDKGTSYQKMADHFNRTKGAIIGRLKRLGYFSE